MIRFSVLQVEKTHGQRKGYTGKAIRFETVRNLTLFFVLIFTLRAQQTGEVRGRVVDSKTHEPLVRVLVRLTDTGAKTESKADGTFLLQGLAAGSHALTVSTVGYHLERQEFTLAEGESRVFDVMLTPSASRKDSVDVSAGVYDLEHQESPAALTLTGTEAKNLSGVLADDPLRAVQSLPGVTSDNDFNSEFSLRGAGFDRIGIFLDGILLHEPFHMVEGQGTHGSLTVFNGDTVGDMTLYEGAWPVQYGDRTAGILAIGTRDGSKDLSFHVSTGFTATSVAVEGSAGKKNELRWITSFRKSYLQYLLNRIDTNVTALAFGFTDGQGRLSYDLSSSHKLTLSFFEAMSSLDRSAAKSTLGVNSLMLSNFDFTMVNAGDRFTPNSKFLFQTRAAWMRERGTSSNPIGLSLGGDGYGEWDARTDATYAWSPGTVSSFGASMRRLREDGNNFEYQSNPPVLVQLDRYRGTGTRTGGYVQQQVGLFHGMVQLAAGVREDHSNVNGVSVASPYGSVTVQPFRATKVQLAWGQYAQFPQLAQSWSVFGSRRLLPERATHYELALEQALDDKTRVKIELYDRQDRDLLWRPLFDPRILSNGAIFFAPNSAPTVNSQRGYARGTQVFLQRRTANGFTGWVSYAYSRAKVTDGVLHLTFPTDNDQKHTVNVFGSYRLRPTVNVSLKWLYGSGFPVPGFYKETNGLYYLSQNRNQLRLPAYQRLDFRLNKAYVHDKWKWTLYAECVNLTNRTNQRFDSFGGYNSKTGQAYPSFMTMFPVLPSVGILFER